MHGVHKNRYAVPGAPVDSAATKGVTTGQGAMTGSVSGATPPRFCGCGTRLARDNRGPLCSACARQQRDRFAGPPELPAAFWEEPHVREALERWHIGAVIAAYRRHPFHRRPLTQALVASWLGITQVKLSRLESGPPLQDLAQLTHYAHTLRVPADLLWFKLPAQHRALPEPPKVRTAHASPPHPDEPAVAPPELAGLLPQLADAVALNRRQLLGGMAAVPGLAHTPPPEGVASVPPEIVGYFRAQLDGHYHADLLLGPHQLIATVASQHQLLTQLVHAARGQVRADLLRLGTAYTGFITWLYQDAGSYQHAVLWANETLDLAHRVQDIQLVSHALTNKAMLATDLGDGHRAVELSEAALAPAGQLCPKVRIQAMQQAAHGYALTGDRPQVDRLLDTAAGLLATVDDDYPWGNACRRSPGYVEVQRATCYGRLHLTQEADDLWQQVMAALPPTSRRDKGVYLARQATVSADAAEPDQAAALIQESAPLAAQTGSARMRQELVSAWHRLEPWHHTDAGRSAAHALASLGVTTAPEGA